MIAKLVALTAAVSSERDSLASRTADFQLGYCGMISEPTKLRAIAEIYSYRACLNARLAALGHIQFSNSCTYLLIFCRVLRPVQRYARSVAALGAGLSG